MLVCLWLLGVCVCVCVCEINKDKEEQKEGKKGRERNRVSMWESCIYTFLQWYIYVLTAPSLFLDWKAANTLSVNSAWAGHESLDSKHRTQKPQHSRAHPITKPAHQEHTTQTHTRRPTEPPSPTEPLSLPQIRPTCGPQSFRSQQLSRDGSVLFWNMFIFEEEEKKKKEEIYASQEVKVK